MKIKLDENLPFSLAIQLRGLGHDVHTAYKEGLTGHPDREIWEVAQKESRFLITQDLDFSDLRQFAPGSHHGILLFRLRSPSRENLAARVGELFQTETLLTGRAASLLLRNGRFSPEAAAQAILSLAAGTFDEPARRRQLLRRDSRLVLTVSC
jgi:predicted nuclease of predicted toxin-antitoxin system